MEILIEEKRKQAHEFIDKIEDESSLDRFLALLELDAIKVDRDPKNGISGEEARKRLKNHIDSLPWEK